MGSGTLSTLVAWITLLLVSAYAAEESIPRDAPGFGTYVREQVQRELPGLAVEVSDALVLAIHLPGQAQVLNASLERVFDFCARSADGCEPAVEQFVSGLTALVRDRLRPITRAMLRVALRQRRAMEEMQRAVPADSPPFLLRPFLGDLVSVVVLDYPTATRPVTTTELLTLRVTTEQAFDIGLANLRAALPRLPDNPPSSDPHEPRYLRDGPDTASRLLLHSDWAATAAAFDHKLLVAIPGDDLLIYARHDGMGAVARMRQLANEAAVRVERPLSHAVFRWTASGWVEAR